MTDRKDGLISRYGEERSRSAIPKVVVPLLILLFMVMPALAQIDIVDIGTGYDLIYHYGFVDYQNVGTHNISCVLQVYIDGEIVASETRDMPIRYLVGFRCSPVKTLEFPLRTLEGDHIILVHAQTQNVSLERTFTYYAEDWWIEDEIEGDTEEEVEDWLSCHSRGLQHEHSHSPNYPFFWVPVPKYTVDINKKEVKKIK